MNQRRNEQLSVILSTAARQRRDASLRSTIRMVAAVKNRMIVAFAGRVAKNQTFTSGGTVATVAGRHLLLKTNEGLAKELVSPQPLLGHQTMINVHLPSVQVLTLI